MGSGNELSDKKEKFFTTVIERVRNDERRNLIKICTDMISKKEENKTNRPHEEMRYSGAGWVEKSMKVKNMSRLGKKVAEIMGQVYLGIYHIEQRALNKVDWAHNGWIKIKLRDCLSTWDFNRLTTLVFACHDSAVRVEISGNSHHMLMLRFHERQREGGMSERHPTIEKAVESWRKNVGDALLLERSEEKS